MVCMNVNCQHLFWPKQVGWRTEMDPPELHNTSFSAREQTCLPPTILHRGGQYMQLCFIQQSWLTSTALCTMSMSRVGDVNNLSKSDFKAAGDWRTRLHFLWRTFFLVIIGNGFLYACQFTHYCWISRMLEDKRFNLAGCLSGSL